VSGFAALQIDWDGKFFVTVQSPAGDARNFLFINDGLTILRNGDHSSNQRDVLGLPCSRLARLLRRRSQEAIHTSGAHRWPLWLRIVFDLKFVPSAQVDPAI